MSEMTPGERLHAAVMAAREETVAGAMLPPDPAWFERVARALLADYAAELIVECNRLVDLMTRELKLTDYRRFDFLDAYTDGLDYAIRVLENAPDAETDE